MTSGAAVTHESTHPGSAQAQVAQDRSTRVGARASIWTRLLSFVRAFARELLVVIAAGLTYAGVRVLTKSDPQQAFANAHRLFHFENTLGIAWEATMQRPVLNHASVRDGVNWMYIYGHWPLIAIIATGLYVWRRERYTMLRNAVLLSGLIGFAFFALYPMAPPRLAHLGLIDTVTRWSSGYRVLQPPKYTNEFASMPSLHFGWDLLVGIALFGATRNLALRAVAVAMPVCMGFAVVASANHFVLDPIVGGAIVLVSLAIVQYVHHRRLHRDEARLDRSTEVCPAALADAPPPRRRVGA